MQYNLLLQFTLDLQLLKRLSSTPMNFRYNSSINKILLYIEILLLLQAYKQYTYACKSSRFYGCYIFTC